MKNLNELAAHVQALNKKWWTDMDTGKRIERNPGELLMLVITELSEAVEGIRKNLMDDKLPHLNMEVVEMADAKIRLLDFAAGFSFDLSQVDYSGIKKSGNKAENILGICRTVIDIQFANASPSHAIGMIEEYCRHYGLDLDGAVEEKLAYNMTREDHTHEARRLANGKKF